MCTRKNAKNASDLRKRCARGGTRTGFQPLNSRHSPENLRNPLCVRLLCDRFAVARGRCSERGKVHHGFCYACPCFEPEALHYRPEARDSDEYEKCLEWGSKAAFIRAVGITEGTMNHWCRQRESGELKSRSDALREDQRLNAGDKQLLKRVLKENEILKAKLERSEAAVDILGKASALLDAMAKSAAATDPKLEEPEPQRPEWLTPKPGKTSP